MATPGDVDRLLALMTPTLGRGGVPLPTPSVDPQFGGEGDAAHPGGQFGTLSTVATPGGANVRGFGDVDGLLALMSRSRVPSMTMPSVEERAGQLFNRSVGGDPFLSRASMIGGMGPGGPTMGMPQMGGRFSRFGGSNQDFVGLATNRLKQLELESLLKAQFGPNAFLRTGVIENGPFNLGTASVGGTNAATAAGGPISTSAGPNTGGVATAPGETAIGGFSALGSQGQATSAGFNASPQSEGIIGSNPSIGVEGFNASPNVSGFAAPSNIGMSFADNDAESIGIHADNESMGTQGAIAIGLTADGQTVSVNPSTGVVSVGGEQAGVVGGGSGGGATGGGGIGGADAGGVGMDGSSNAGIGGPGGTGAAGGVGAAAGEGAGTGGVGEGEMYGGHFTVGGDPRAGPDSMNVRFKASPGEHVVVVPQGMTPGQILARPEQASSWRMTGNRPNPGPGPTPSAPIPPGTPVNSPGGLEAILRMMAPGRR